MHTLGPCPTCNKMFLSRIKNKKFCSFACYRDSDQMRETLAAHNQAQRANQIEYTCLHCNKQWAAKASRKSKFCSKDCKRAWMDARFDRWIASPQLLPLPQNYDEFMSQVELPCLIPGCDWVGDRLGMHLNLTHGITAERAREMAGFNMRTGLVGASERARMRVRALENGAHERIAESRKPFTEEALERARCADKRAEGKEHAAKSRAVLMSGTGPERACQRCGVVFKDRPAGHSKFCTIECRDAFAAARRFPLTCSLCGNDFQGTAAQRLRDRRQRPVFCSPQCKGTHNSPPGVPKRRSTPDAAVNQVGPAAPQN